MADGLLEAVLRRDRAAVAGGLIVLAALAWAYVVWVAAGMDMGGMDMSGYRTIPGSAGLMTLETAPWTRVEFAYTLAMWIVMMVGMMTPSAAPMILIYARVARQAAAGGKPFAPSIWFVIGYLALWTAFALGATLMQWGLQRAALLTPTMASSSVVLGGFLLIAAGLYQWTPLKNACLRRCRAPLLFIQEHGGFRGDVAGCLLLGIKHGAYCVGCCWALMALLFVGGVMNVLWVAAISIFILAEKVVGSGRAVSLVAGTCLVAAGLQQVTTAIY
jgi:predicted metal-binding membrane protein